MFVSARRLHLDREVGLVPTDEAVAQRARDARVDLGDRGSADPTAACTVSTEVPSEQ